MCSVKCLAIFILFCALTAGLKLKLKFYYDSSFFIFNEGYHSNCCRRIRKMGKQLQDIFSMPSFGYHMNIQVDSEIVRMLSEKWRAAESDLDYVGNLLKGKEANQHVFMTVHNFNQM